MIFFPKCCHFLGHYICNFNVSLRFESLLYYNLPSSYCDYSSFQSVLHFFHISLVIFICSFFLFSSSLCFLYSFLFPPISFSDPTRTRQVFIARTNRFTNDSAAHCITVPSHFTHTTSSYDLIQGGKRYSLSTAHHSCTIHYLHSACCTPFKSLPPPIIHSQNLP